MKAQLKKTLGLMVGVIGSTLASHAQLDIEWTTTVNLADLSFPGNTDISYSRTKWSQLSGSYAVCLSIVDRDSRDYLLELMTHIDKKGKFVGSHALPSGSDLILLAEDWFLLEINNNGIRRL